MRPFVVFSTFFSLFFAAASVAADRTEIIGNKDQRISYTNGWISFLYPTGDGRTMAVATRESDTATLKMNNVTRIAVAVFAEVVDQKVRISLDGQNHDIFPTILQQPAWTSDLLDPSVPHTIQVIKQNLNGSFISLDSFIVTYPSPNITGSTSTVLVQSTSTSTSTSTTETETETETETPAKQSDGRSGLTISTKAGIAIAAVGMSLGLLGALWVYLQRKRKNRDSTLFPFNKVVVPLPQSSDAPYAGTGGVSPFESGGGVEVQLDISRKNGGLDGGINPIPERRIDGGEDAATFPLEEVLVVDPALSERSAPPEYTP